MLEAGGLAEAQTRSTDPGERLRLRPRQLSLQESAKAWEARLMPMLWVMVFRSISGTVRLSTTNVATQLLLTHSKNRRASSLLKPGSLAGLRVASVCLFNVQFGVEPVAATTHRLDYAPTAGFAAVEQLTQFGNAHIDAATVLDIHKTA